MVSGPGGPLVIIGPTPIVYKGLSTDILNI